MSDLNAKLADLAVESGYCEPQQIESAMAEVARLRDLGIEKNLADLLFERELLDDRQREKLTAIAQPTPLARMLPGYEMQDAIGKGGMGVVYRARHLGLDKIVAVKVLPPKFANDPQFVERFLREARAAGRLNHENIVHAIDAGEQKGYYYYIMEYVEGETAKQRLRRTGPLSETEAMELLRQMGEALAHVHRHDLIHRDVKPENIIYTNDDVAKLCDLGLARVTTEEASAGSKMATFGTPLYISPEQITSPHDLDGRCDLYSLGATVYHLVCNTPPYYGETKAETVAGHLSPDPAPPASIHAPHLSAGFVRVLSRLLEKGRDDRYLGAEALLADLADLRAGRTPGVAVYGGRTNWTVWGGAAVVAVVAVSATLAFTGGDPPLGPGEVSTSRFTPGTGPATPSTTTTAAPFAVPNDEPGADDYADLQARARAEAVPSPELIVEFEELLDEYPDATWVSEVGLQVASMRRDRRAAASEALRAALSRDGTADLYAAAGRYGDTAPGRAATAAAAFRAVVAEDAVVGWVAEAARAEAAGDLAGATALVTRALEGGASGAAPALKLLSAARITAEDLRDADRSAFGEARYHHGMGRVWAFCRGHRFDDAKRTLTELTALLEPASRASISAPDHADLKRLTEFAVQARGWLGEQAASAKTITLELRAAGRARGVLRISGGGFKLRTPEGDLAAELPDLTLRQLEASAMDRLSATDARAQVARGILFYLDGQDALAKEAFRRAVKRGASRHRFLDAVMGVEVGGEESHALHARDAALGRLEAGDVVGARTALATLLSETRFQATSVVRRDGDEVRAKLEEAIALTEASYRRPLELAAKGVDDLRPGDLAAGEVLKRAVLVNDPEAIPKAIEGLRLVWMGGSRGRLGKILAYALEGAPKANRPWLIEPWREWVRTPVPRDATAAWVAIARK